jgi:hypothetical protein
VSVVHTKNRSDLYKSMNTCFEHILISNGIMHNTCHLDGMFGLVHNTYHLVHTLVGRVVDMHVGRKINQQSMIFGWWIDYPNNRLRVGHMDDRVKHPYRVDSMTRI